MYLYKTYIFRILFMLIPVYPFKFSQFDLAWLLDETGFIKVVMPMCIFCKLFSRVKSSQK